MTVNLPKFDAGCGGIDLYAGGFSFINSDQLIGTLKSVGSSSIGYAFLLGLETVSPQVANTIKNLQTWANNMNAFNINSCETAAGLVGSAWPRQTHASQHVCRTLGGKKGLFDDYLKARHNCSQNSENKRFKKTISEDKEYRDLLYDDYNLVWDDSISQSYQKAQMHAQSATETTQQSYGESVATSSRHMADLSDHLSKSESYSENFSEREAYDLQERARYFQNLSESWGKQHGLSSRQGMETALGLGIDFGVTAKTSQNLGSNEEHLLSSANNIVKSEEFQKHFQRLQDFSQSNSYNALDEKGMRLVESTSQSLDNTKNSQEMYQTAQSNLDQVTDNATWAQQNSHLIKRSLNQDFINWASEKYTDQGGFGKVEDVLINGNQPQQEALVHDFIGHVRQSAPTLSTPHNFVDPSASRNLPKELSMETAQESIRNSISSNEGHFANNLNERKEALSGKISQIGERNSENFSQVSSKIDRTRQSATQDFQTESERSGFLRQFDEVGELKESIKASHPLLTKLTDKLGLTGNEQKPVAYVNNFQMTEEPFWMEKEKR